LLILGVLLFQARLAAPWPDLDRRDLSYQLAQDELDSGVALLARLGISTTRQALSQDVLRLGQLASRTKHASRAPFGPLLRLTGTGQAWGLFAYPDPYAGRLVIAARRLQADGSLTPWQELYRAHGQGEAWLCTVLEYRRVRGVYDDNGDRPKPGIFYDRFADWIAAEIMVREPDVAEVQVRLDRVTIRSPDDARPAGAETPGKVRRRDRAQVAERLALRGGALMAVAPIGVAP